jgi:hypothetical protein
MRRLLQISCILAVAVATAAAAPGAQKSQIVKAGAGQLVTGVWWVHMASSAETEIEIEHIQAAGAKSVRVLMYWSAIAPSGSKVPTGFQARNPADSNYHWQLYDDDLRAISDAGLEPNVTISYAPAWAEGTPRGSSGAGTYKPSPTALADFVTAAAKRYSGSFKDLPRVRYWSIWNEPNLSAFLNPQTVNGKAFAPYWYRAMLNASADAIHSVKADNVVIAGETAPFWEAELPKTAPITFMEKVLCISEKRVRNKRTQKTETVYRSACEQRTKFDVWAHHPYSEGGPTHRAQVHGNASLGNMGDIRSVLNAAIRAKHVVSKQKKIRLWMNEFSWESNPPDPGGVPVQLEARWVSQALFQAWKAGVSLFTWFALDDSPVSQRISQGGLYYRDNSGIASYRAKPALRSFRFPFVAFPEKKDIVYLWGRTPTSAAGNVLIERKSGAAWKVTTKLTANRYGIFHARIQNSGQSTYLRARLANGSDRSNPFSLIAPKKTWVGCVWGSPCPYRME